MIKVHSTLGDGSTIIVHWVMEEHSTLGDGST